MKPCLKCNKETDLGLSMDIDLPLIPACKDCIEEVKQDFTIALMTNEIIWFEKKYKI